MLDFKKYQRGRFNNIKFYCLNSSIKWGQKTITHTYPKSSRTEVEFLGLNKKLFSIELMIDNEFYFSNRKDILKQLNKGSYGTLIHPIDGEIKVAVINSYNVVENDTELGICKISVEFQEVSDKKAPDKKVSLFSRIVNGINQALETSNDIINDNYVVDFVNNLTKAQQQILSITEEVQYQANKIFSDQGILGDIKSLTDSFDNDPLGVVSTAGGLTDYLSNLLNLFSRGGESKDNATAFISMFDLGDNIDTNELTLENTENKKNTEAINTYSQFQYLLYVYNNGLSINFFTIDEVENFINSLEIQYNKLYDSLTIELQDQIDNLKSDLYEYLRGLELYDTIEVKTQKQSLESFVYQYYGNLDFYDKIKDLNNLNNPAFCNPTMKIFQIWT
ncbi:MAG: hypothetical protein BV456_00995 [Thermoplasmata archaeon M8B2D]|nr:MAG: hypothetical protein BV456_00995 [Thermoplasmata archaeon M8B2D]